MCSASVFTQKKAGKGTSSVGPLRPCPGLRIAKAGGPTSRFSVLFLADDGRESSF